MRSRQTSIISLIVIFLILSFLLRYFWWLILVILGGIVIFIWYLRYKSFKIFTSMNEDKVLNEDGNYNNWDNVEKTQNNLDVIDVEYTEHKE